MMLDQLEARFQLEPGLLSAVEMRGAPLYTRTRLLLPRKSWNPSAKLRTRFVWKPCAELKDIQRQIVRLISGRFEPHPIAHAYARGRGIVSNASQHVGKEWLFHVDLVNFFGSVKEEQVFKALQMLMPDFSEWEIGALARLCCHEGYLPQGAPSSPMLSNLVCFALDEELHELGRSLSATVTRYSDDICFSSTDATFPLELASIWGRGADREITLGPSLCRLFEKHGFEVNLKKLRFQDRAERQQVTGLVVNDGVNVPREYYQNARGSLSLWRKRGVEIAARHYQPWLPVEKFVPSLKGLIDYIGQVTGRRDERHRNLLSTFEGLIARG